MSLVQTEPLRLQRFRLRTLLGCGAVALVLAGIVVIYLRGRQPLLLASGPGRIVQIRATGDGLFWLESREGADPAGPNSALRCLSRLGATPTTVCEGTNLLGFDIDRDGTTVFLLEGGPRGREPRLPFPHGRLLQIPVSGGAPTVLLQDLVNPGQLWIDEQAFYWTETYPTQAPAVNHMPPLHYLTLIRTCSRPGTGNLEVSLLAQVEGSQPVLQGQLLGVEGNHLYWLERRYVGYEPGFSFLRRVAVTGGEIETLLMNPGQQTAAMGPGAIFFTAYSVESAPPTAYWVVYRYPLKDQGGELLTDWLYPSGKLLWRERKLYYAHGTGLWRVPLQWGPPCQCTYRLLGAQVVDVRGGFFYAAIESGEGANAAAKLLRQPAEWKAWIRNGLSRFRREI